MNIKNPLRFMSKRGEKRRATREQKWQEVTQRLQLVRVEGSGGVVRYVHRSLVARKRSHG